MFKKQIIKALFILFLSLVNLYGSQPKKLSQAYAGYTIGTNYNKTMNMKIQRHDISFSPESRIGMNFGAFVSYSNNSWYDFQTELNLISKGMQTNDWKYHLNYIEMPILLKIPLRREYGIKPLLMLGLSPSYMISSKITENEKSGTKNYYSGEVETFDICLIGGLGFNIPYSNSLLFFDVSYSYGLISSFSSNTNYLDQAVNAPRFNNHSVIFKMGYGLKL